MVYLREWGKNLFRNILVFLLVCIGMGIFTWIFYPDALSLLILTGDGTIQLANGLNLWPIIILGIIISALPRPKRKL